MQDSSTGSKYSTEVDSDILNLSESCVRSDIAEIISKMYTPRGDMANGGGGGASYEGFETRQSAVSREVYLRMDDEPSNRIGIFRETISRNDIRSLVCNTSEKDSSMSDSVSLPIVENVMRNTRKRCAYYCECCRRSAVNKQSMNRAKRACRRCCYCHQNRCVDAVVLPQSRVQSHLELCNPLERKDQGDFTLNEKFVDTNDDFSKEVPKLEEHTGTCTQCALKRKFLKSQPVNGHEDLQCVPNTEREDNNKDTTVPKAVNVGTKVKSKTFLRRFITSWHVIFQKNHDVGSKYAIGKTNSLQIAIPGTELNQEPTYTCSCQNGPKKKSIYTNCKSATELVQKEHVNPSCVEIDNKLLKCEEMRKGKDQEWKSDIEKSSSKKHVGKIEEMINKNDKDEINNKDLNCNQKHQSKVDLDRNSYLPHPYPLNHGGFYCYDYETAKYYWKTSPSPMVREAAVSKSEDWAFKFWAEVFGPCRTVAAFFTAFFLELFRFVLSGVVYPLLWKSVECVSDFFFRPCLSTLFSSVIQPIFLLFQNITTAIRDACFPISQCFGNFFAEIADVCRACRLVEINRTHNAYGNQLNP